MSSQVRPRSTEAFFKPERTFPKRSPSGMPIGKRTEERHRQNKELGKLKITRCEVQLPGICVHDRMLSWSHSRKSRFLVTAKDWQEAARCCLPCHQTIENMSHADMAKIVRDAISKRKPNENH